MSKLNKQSLAEPAWYDIASLPTLNVPAGCVNWLVDAGSLTSKLIDTCSDGKFSVRLMGQYWMRPQYSERQVLGMRHGRMALIREVQLLCNGTPWVFARTLIPATSFSGRARRLAYLGNRPLGALLFSDPATVREGMQFARLSAGHHLFEHAVQSLSSAP